MLSHARASPSSQLSVQGKVNQWFSSYLAQQTGIVPYSCLSCFWAQVLTSTKDIEMWGDGLQTRSFTFIDDCVEGILRITKSDFKEPLNLGSSEMVSAFCHTSAILQVSVSGACSGYAWMSEQDCEQQIHEKWCVVSESPLSTAWAHRRILVVILTP